MAAKYSTRNESATRAVLYLRRSSSKQETSIEDQRSSLVDYAERQGYGIVGEYVDDGISGDAAEKRTEFLKMREDTSSGDFGIILCWDQDRFGRFDILDAGKWIAPIREANVRLETIAQGKIDWEDLVGQLIFSANQMGKAQFLRDLSRNSLRGQIESAKKNRCVCGRANYGYRTVRERGEDGKLIGSYLVVDIEKAAIVRRIFDEYIQAGGSLRSLINGLYRDNIPSPAGKKWSATSVRRILTRKKYLGSYVWGENSQGNYHGYQNGEIVKRRKGQKDQASEPIIHENSHEPIVDQETFDKTQQLLDQRKRDTSPVRRKAGRTFVLSGLMRCGNCGAKMNGRQQNKKNSKEKAYTCSRYWFQGKDACSYNYIAEAPLVEYLLRRIRDEYFSPDARRRLRDAMTKAAVKPNSKPNLTAMRKRLAELDRKIDQGSDRVFDAPADLVDGLYGKLEDLKANRNSLQAEIDATKPASTQQTNKEIDQALDLLPDLDKLYKTADPHELRELLTAIVVSIDLHFTKYQAGKLTRTRFKNGVIHVRPQSILPDMLRSSTR